MLKEKLHPSRFPGMSNRMAYLLSGILDEQWVTHPDAGPCEQIYITSDGYVLAGDGNLFIGSVGDFERNIQDLLTAAGLADDERQEFQIRYTARVTDFRNIGM